MTTDTLDTAIKSLKHEEGFRGHPYHCSEGVLTVGYGTAFPITPMEASMLLLHRTQNMLSELESQVDAHFDMKMHDLPEVVQRALLEMAYQLGVNGLLGFRRMFEAIRTEDWVKAHDEALDSRWARQTPGRAARMAALLLNGRVHTRATGRMEVSI